MQADPASIHAQVKRRFASLAVDPASEKRFDVGRSSALKLGYASAVLDSLPKSVVDSFAGVGNPLAIAPLSKGMTVLDLGCGSGVDALIAARAVGSDGSVTGIDMTSPMVEKAQNAVDQSGLRHVRIRAGLAEHLDLEDESIDVVVSNGVINLCPDKEQVLAELYRVLRPGGRLQVADMSLVEGVNPELLERVGEWSD